MYGTRSATQKAPATDPRLAESALLICSHGSRDGGRAVRARAHSLHGTGGFAETAGCLLFGEPSLEQAIETLSSETVYLVPLFMAEGVTASVLESRLAALDDGRRLVPCPTVGSHPALPGLMVRAIESRLHRLSWPACETAVVLVGHGSWRSQASRRATERMAAAVAGDGRFAEVAVALLENGPNLVSVLESLEADRVVVVGCFAENGRHAGEDLPALLAETERPTAYLGPVGEAPWFDRLALDLAVRRAAVPGGGSDVEGRR